MHEDTDKGGMREKKCVRFVVVFVSFAFRLLLIGKKLMGQSWIL